MIVFGEHFAGDIIYATRAPSIVTVRRLINGPEIARREYYMDASVIIVNWNTRDFLKDCLASVFAQTTAISYEVIVVDNASSDASAQMVKDEFPRVILVENAANRGFAAANNQGLAIATGRFMLLLNPDTIVLDRAIERTLDFADSHPRAAVVGCRVLENIGKTQKTCFAFPSIGGHLLQMTGLPRLFPRSRVFGKYWMGWWDRDTEEVVDVVSGMFFLVRREAIEEVGPMDEDYFVYCEETDWCYRFRKAGWQCVFTPIASIIHRDGGSKSTEQVRTRMFVQLQKSMLIFFRKNKGSFQWACMKSLFILSMLMKLTACSCACTLGLGRQSPDKASRFRAALHFHLFAD